jgi:hypothetical protein
MTPGERELAADAERDCDAVFPSFRAYRAEHAWYFADDDGAVAACGGRTRSTGVAGATRARKRAMIELAAPVADAVQNAVE